MLKGSLGLCFMGFARAFYATPLKFHSFPRAFLHFSSPTGAF